MSKQTRNLLIGVVIFLVVAVAAYFFFHHKKVKKTESERYNKIRELVKANSLADFLQGKTDAQVKAWADKLTADEYNAVVGALANGGSATAAQQPFLTSANKKLLAA